MSKEGKAPIGLAVAEKFFGLLIILIGVIAIYVTYTNIGSVGSYPGIFILAGFALIAFGVFLILVKAE